MELILGFIILAALGWATVRAVASVSRIARRRTAERQLNADEKRLVARLGYVTPSRTVLLADPEFRDATDKLAACGLRIENLVELALSERRPWVSRIALATLARRDDIPETWPSAAIRRLDGADWDYAGLLLLTLERAPGEVLGPALSKIDDVLATDLAALLSTRVEAGRERIDLRTMIANVARSLRGNVAVLLEEHRESLPESVCVALEQWLDTVPESEPGALRTPGRGRKTKDSAQMQTPPPYLTTVYDGALTLEEAYGPAAASRTQLLEDPVFCGIVDDVYAQHVGSRTPVETLVDLVRDNRIWVSRIALAALGRCDDIPETWPAAAVRRLEGAPWDYAGLLLLSLERAPGEVIGPVISRMNEVLAADLVELIRARIGAGRETIDAELMRRHVGRAQQEQIVALLDEYRSSLPPIVCEVFGQWLGEGIDLGPDLSPLVRIWTRPFVSEPVLSNSQRDRLCDEIVSEVTKSRGKSLIVIGEHGVGKTTLIRSALDAADPRWAVFEAGAAQLNAGAMYIGQLDGRVEELVQRLEDLQAIWVFPSFAEALVAGSYRENPSGLIDRLLPHVERGALRIVAEVTPASYELLIAKRPSIGSAFLPLRVRPLDEDDTIALCRDVLVDLGMSAADDETLRDTFDLAQQFLPGVAPPGNALRLLRATIPRVIDDGRFEVSSTDVISTLSLLSGIPLAMLDPSQPLGLANIRAFLQQRVLGQKEATDVLVDRVALIKAGLTDPTRPLGVFLFVGPTGTGKTELAKALTELLFGSPSRLVRLDMSEYQTPESLERLLADANVDETAAPLIAAVRRDPFSVVLLDEFEKAAPPIRDLFLQLFDDGRLTDRGGHTTDFRRCVIIMTSNVGSALQSGPGLGFDSHVEPFRDSDVERALRRTFRPEFLNRIDRIVVFKPFERDEIQALLQKELDDVVLRRGMRDRPWSIEIDESAMAFLIEKGFSPDLGARPLKRAVEQYVLTPLARAIADAQVPTGDQFLFLTANSGRIDVQFVGLEDDDAETETQEHDDEETEGDGHLGVEPPVAGGQPDSELRALLRSRARAADASERLAALLGGVQARVDGEVALRKQLLLGEVSTEGFWERGDRFEVLDETEYLDRLEAATRTAQRLGERLRHADDPNARREVAELLANRLYVLDQALAGLDRGSPFEIFMRLGIAAGADRAHEAVAFLDQIRDMYVRWASRCGMKMRELSSADGRLLLAVSGLGAGAILADEAGLHVSEIVGSRDGDTEIERIAVSVEIVGAPRGEPTRDRDFVAQAVAVLDAAESPGQVTRRYQVAPSPLVRDNVRGYRTGRIDRVLGGDFDLFAP